MRGVLRFLIDKALDCEPGEVRVRYAGTSVPELVVLTRAATVGKESQVVLEDYVFTDGRRYYAGGYEGGNTLVRYYRIRGATWLVVARLASAYFDGVCGYNGMDVIVYGDRSVMDGVLRAFDNNTIEYVIVGGNTPQRAN
mgnify:FL=1